MLRAFGCLCYASTLKIDRHKVEPRAQPSVFIEYSQKQKAYKLYCLETKKIYVSRDMKFYEKFFLFHYHDMNKSSIEQFFLLQDSSKIEDLHLPDTLDN